MKTKTENIALRPDYGPLADVSGMIQHKHQDLLMSTNLGLINLFWELGRELNRYIKANKTTVRRRSVLSAISGQLVTAYGPHFIEKNLKKMVLLADQFPDRLSMAQIATYLSWDHILLLLKIKNWEAKAFYIRHTVEQDLGVNALRKQIAGDLFERQPIRKAGKGTGTVRVKQIPIAPTGLKQGKRIVPVIKNYFKDPWKTSFHALLAPGNEAVMTMVEDKPSTGIEEELFGVLSLHIEKFRSTQNRRLNTDLNVFFRKIGEHINKEIQENRNENVTRESIISNAAIYLEKRFGKNFSEDQLQQMALFAEQFTDAHIAWRIASLVTWEHIIALLPLREIEAKLFYARLAASEGLSVAILQQAIAGNVFKRTIGAKEQEQLTIAAIQNPTIEKKVETKGNSTVSITNVLIDLGSDLDSSLVVSNIFKNTCFLDFISKM